MFEIELEHALEQARPAHARPHAVRVFARGFAGFLRRAWHDRGTQPGIGREHPVETDQVQARARHQRGKAGGSPDGRLAPYSHSIINGASKPLSRIELFSVTSISTVKSTVI